MSGKEVLYKGSYEYFAKNNCYTNEDFSIEQDDKSRNYLFKSHMLSRLKTGEILKINISYETNTAYEPVRVSVSKNVGDKFAQEIFEPNLTSRNIRYSFFGSDGSHDFEKPIQGRFQISTPSILTSMIMIKNKKAPVGQRIPFTFITSNNTWSYEGPFFEHLLFIEQDDHKLEELEINEKKLMGKLFKVYSTDNTASLKPAAASYYLSKHHTIPYLVKIGDDVEIKVKFLQKVGNEIKKYF